MLELYKTKNSIRKRLKEIRKGVTFAKDGHTYKRIRDGKYLSGASSVSGLIPKPWLAPWASKENHDYLQKNWDIDKEYTKEEKKELLYKAKNAYRGKSDKAKNTGTRIHKLLEQCVNLRMDKERTLDESKWLKMIEKKDGEDVKRAVSNFLKWESKIDIDWIASEAITYSNYYDIAGTFDGLAFINGNLIIIDFKTSKILGEEYFIQMAIYKMILQEWGIDPKQRLLIGLPKNSKMHFRTKVVPTPYDYDRDVAIALQKEAQWLNHYKSQIKGQKEVLLMGENEKKDTLPEKKNKKKNENKSKKKNK